MDRWIACQVVALAAWGVSSVGCASSPEQLPMPAGGSAPPSAVTAAGGPSVAAAGSGGKVAVSAAAAGGPSTTSAAGSGAPSTTPAAGSGGTVAPPPTTSAGAPAPAAGSAGSAGQAAPSGNERLPCDVADVVSRQCLSCHGSPTNLGAPMMLVTYADFHRAAPSNASKQVYELVGIRVADTQMPMPPKANGKIAVRDQKVLVDWSSQGGPARAATSAECTP